MFEVTLCCLLAGEYAALAIIRPARGDLRPGAHMDLEYAMTAAVPSYRKLPPVRTMTVKSRDVAWV